MKILISNQSELPIYAQIREQIKEQILNGEIQEGATLPSIRKLAKEIGVSVITTTRAYNDLEKEGFITSIQGKGSIVLSKENEIMHERYIMRIEDHIISAIETAMYIGIDEIEFSHLVSGIWKELKK